MSFVLAHLGFFKETHGYTLHRDCKKPGQKAHIWPAFRDVWLPEALRSIRAEDAGVPIDAIPETTYRYKHNQVLGKSGEPCIQGVVGWEDPNAESRPSRKHMKRLRAAEKAEAARDAAERLLELTGGACPP